jgi:hypothetical protein
MKIIVDVLGVYNDAAHRAHRLQPGDELETGHEYAHSLIASGLAHAPTPVGETEPTTTTPPADVFMETAGADPVGAPPADEIGAPAAEEPAAQIDLADGVDDTEASLAGKALAFRGKKNSKK